MDIILFNVHWPSLVGSIGTVRQELALFQGHWLSLLGKLFEFYKSNSCMFFSSCRFLCQKSFAVTFTQLPAEFAFVHRSRLNSNNHNVSVIGVPKFRTCAKNEFLANSS